MNQEYRVNLKLRRRGQAALETHHVEFQSEEYDDDEQMSQAIASEVLEMIKADRDYLSQKYDVETVEPSFDDVEHI